MSTRACYTFIDSDACFTVYVHCDGYPTGAADKIAAALPLAWELPRFEADEFGAAFIAGNKSHGGNVRLTTDYNNHADIEYRYEVFMKKVGKKEILWVRAYTYHSAYTDHSGSFDEKNWVKIIDCAQTEFAAAAKAYEETVK